MSIGGRFMIYLSSRWKAICTIIALFLSVLAINILPISASNEVKADTTNAELSIGSATKANLEEISTFEGGSLYKAGKFNVIALNGNYRKMGRQYGGLLGPQIKGMYEELANAEPSILAEMKNLSTMESDDNLTLEKFTSYSFQTYPKRFQEMILGMSETSGMPVEEIAEINEFIRFYVFFKWLEEPGTGIAPRCSSLTAWGNYTAGMPLVMGRNFDAPLVFERFDKYLTVVVLNPTDGSNSVALFNYAGMVVGAQSFNEAGLVWEGDDASTAGDNNRPLERVPVEFRQVQLMFDYSNLVGLDAGMKSSRISHGAIITVANESEAYTYEVTTFDIKKRGGIDGLLVAANHFIIPGWESEGILTNRSSSSGSMMNSVSRFQNLTALGNKYKGKINATVMMTIYDTLMEDGGATYDRGTTFQFVVVPEERKIWIKARGYEDWREVDLDALYK
jgi:hypothetical protein